MPPWPTLIVQRLAPRRAGAHAAIFAAALCALLAGVNAPAHAGDNPASNLAPKASSLEPHHTRRRVYGAPIQQPILHKRHKHARAAQPATPAKPAPKEPAAPTE